jgi:hypothetical protein
MARDNYLAFNLWFICNLLLFALPVTRKRKKSYLDANGKTLAVEQTLTRALVIDFIEKTFHYDRIPSLNSDENTREII